MFWHFTRYPFLVSVFVTIVLTITSGDSAASSKVYTIDASKLIKWVTRVGYKLESKNMNRYTLCSTVNNVLKVRRNPALDPLSQFLPECLFTVFKPGTLAKGWKVQKILVISNGLGKWKYITNPKGKASLMLKIRANYSQVGADSSHDIKMVKIILLGPAKSTSWEDAIVARR